MIARYILHLRKDIFLNVVVKNDFPSVGWYLFRVVTYLEVVIKMHFILLVLVMYLLPDG